MDKTFAFRAPDIIDTLLTAEAKTNNMNKSSVLRKIVEDHFKTLLTSDSNQSPDKKS